MTITQSAAVLVVDDDRAMCELVATWLSAWGYRATSRSSVAEALDALDKEPYEAIVTDLRMAGGTGLELCERAVGRDPDLPVILMTAFGNLDAAVAAMRAGAFDFVVKPVQAEVLGLAVARAVRQRRLGAEVRRLRREVEISERFDELAGRSPVMLRLFRLLDQVAASGDTSVLIRGETGTGKELVARALHRKGPRSSGPFVAINCAAMPEALLESELFGHAAGAFTGARERHTGLLVQANGGTVFLDEVGDMSPTVQAKLLRALQERRVRAVGGDEVPVDARVVAATHHDLEALVEEGRFRQDLFFRLHVIGVTVPPLRERGDDVLLLAQRFVETFARRADKPVVGITAAAAERLLSYAWPGNVRELQNAIERAIALTTSDRLVVEDLPDAVRAYRPQHVVIAADDPATLAPLHEVERRYVLKVLEAVQGNKTLAASVLGIDRKTLASQAGALVRCDTGVIVPHDPVSKMIVAPASARTRTDRPSQDRTSSR